MVITFSGSMEFKDYFSAQSNTYSKSRPNYPDELFQFLSSIVHEHNLVWDCATGNGQAAVSLAKYFKKVIATDASEQQIKNAIPNERVIYYVALADNSGIETGTVDLVTIASALHWMDFDKFYQEVNRVLKPGGIFAAWAYYKSHIDKAIDPFVKYLSKDILGEYWPPERTYVTNYYNTLPFPFKAIETPSFKISLTANIDFLIGYFYSWSSTQQYIKMKGKDPVDLIRKELENAWGDLSETREITWDIILKIRRKE
jgi:ubiquinone/menaquinone biosynthesis C-methylase UbiE